MLFEILTKKMKRIILVAATLMFAVAVSAQNEVVTVGSGEDKEEVGVPESMRSDMDSMYCDWQTKYLLFTPDDCRQTPVGPVVTDSVIMERLGRLPATIEMPFNEVVRKFVDIYSNRLRKKVSFMLAAGNLYMPVFEEALDVYNMPIELKYLPVIESALNPKAKSRAGAAGLWQFMYRTGKIYGLENNSLVDERCDPYKATWAAVRYMKDLYDIYKDWNLVLAAYNCGPGTINKAIHRSGGKTDFWELYPFLPKETRGYVPSFIAANYIMNYYCEHGITPMETKTPVSVDTVMVNKDINLNQIAGVCEVDVDMLRSLNPQYKTDLVPGGRKPCSITMPHEMVGNFIDNQEKILVFEAKKYQNRRSTAKIGGPKGIVPKYHRVRSGETLGHIARKYGTTVSRLRRLNGLRNNNIRAGKSLRVR